MCRRVAIAVGVLLVAVAALPASATPDDSVGTSSYLTSWDTLRTHARRSFASMMDTVQTTSRKAAEELVRFAMIRSNKEEVCYRVLGCFSLQSPWISLFRPLPAPKTPEKINVRYYLYTRRQPERFTVVAAPHLALEDSTFDGAKQTFIITHGFMNSGNETWMSNLKDAILNQVDGNVFIVDWGGGAIDPNYLQAASNTRVVGREIGWLVRTLIESYGASASRLHLMGHSLGAHISGYAARNITGVARITAFDPAGPGFELLPQVVRLNRDAADFVDVLHTNAKPITSLGFGMMNNIGHVDFYMNGGIDQPGCSQPKMDYPKSLLDLVTIPMHALSGLVSCSHSRSYEYMIEAIANPGCRMWGHKVNAVEQKLSWLRHIPAIVPHDEATECENARCIPIGLDAVHYPALGTFSVITNAMSPFCRQEDSDDGQTLEELEELGYFH